MDSDMDSLGMTYPRVYSSQASPYDAGPYAILNVLAQHVHSIDAQLPIIVSMGQEGPLFRST